MKDLDSLKEDLKSIHAISYYNLLLTSSWIEIKLKEALKPYDLTHAQLNVLSVLVQNHPEPMPANALKEKMLVSNPDVTRLLDRLVKKGFVFRETCPENRRKINISVTENGIDFYYKAHFAAKEAVSNYFEDQISLEEAIELRRILHKIRE